MRNRLFQSPQILLSRFGTSTVLLDMFKSILILDNKFKIIHSIRFMRVVCVMIVTRMNMEVLGTLIHLVSQVNSIYSQPLFGMYHQWYYLVGVGIIISFISYYIMINISLIY